MVSTGDVEVIRRFRKELARYRAYLDELGADSGILAVSLQCLTDDPEERVTELFALVAPEEEPSYLPANASAGQWLIPLIHNRREADVSA
jgi:hypothetical protein